MKFDDDPRDVWFKYAAAVIFIIALLLILFPYHVAALSKLFI